jgi:subtilisin family serine protease
MKNIGTTRIFAASLAVGLLLLSIGGLLSGNDDGQDATLNENFTNDVVIVVMTGEASLNLNTYTIHDFPEVELGDVRSLSTAVESNVREQLLERQNGLDLSQRDTFWDVDIEEFKQILSLTLQTPGRENVLRAIRILEQREDVYAVEPNYLVFPSSLSNMRAQAAVSRINLSGAWGITTGSAAVTVGIMDTGIDASRPDLAGRIHPTLNFHGDFTGSSISPFIDDGFPHSWNGHGTHVAGIVGPLSAWNVRLVSLRVFNTVDGRAPAQSVLAAINHATLRNIRILNFSADGYPYSTALEQQIRNYNGLFVTSAGNSNLSLSPTSNHIGRVSRVTVPNLIVVGASNNADARWIDSNTKGSNWGGAVVDIFAPGFDILSTVPTSIAPTGYFKKSGTSMAAPFVTGVAALMNSTQLGFLLNGRSIRNIITRSSNLDAMPSSGLCITNGRLNAYKALNFTVNNWQPCTQWCMNTEQVCIAGCQNECEYIIQNPICLHAFGVCMEQYNSCLSGCEFNCTHSYGNLCYVSCS